MYLGIVPIVKRSVMTEHFCAIGLPLLLVDDWRELSAMTEGRLSEIYQQLKPGVRIQSTLVSVLATAVRKPSEQGLMTW